MTLSTTTERIVPSTVMRLIALRAQRHPDALALLAPDREALTYRALVREIECTTSWLAAAGLGQGTRIAVVLPNGPEMAVALLAVMDCATCAPLNPMADEDTCRWLLQSLRIDALMVMQGDDSPASRTANAMGLPILQMDVSQAAPAGVFNLTTSSRHQAIAAHEPEPGTTALLLHTSGTTATPKSVPLSSRQLLQSAIARARILDITRADRCLAAAPMFTASFIKRNLLTTLGAGASLVCTRGFDADRFVTWVERYQPTFYTGNPTIHHLMLEAVRQRGRLAHALRFVISSSAPMPVRVHDEIESALGVPVLNAYAMTEGGAIAQTPLPPAPRRPASVGLPVECEVAILGAAGEFAASGVQGEIVVRGPDVFEGYENDDDANRNAFHDGWFRTGDLGYIDADGYVYISGRLKEMINRGGFKVSPTEVDAVLTSHADVAEAATFAVPHASLGEDVVAAVVVQREATVTTQQLRDMVMQRLAAYKVPSRIVVVSSIPKNALGKFRRDDLPALYADLLRGEDVAPSGRYEMLVAAHFEDVLGVQRVGTNDNFFALGGDSLSGVQLVARLNAALGLDVDASRLFWRPTVAGFAGELAATAARGQQSMLPPIVPVARKPDTVALPKRASSE
jgi:acyl-CoA synthetase (AMP-forming)/AMP-acid ligase II